MGTEEPDGIAESGRSSGRFPRSQKAAIDDRQERALSRHRIFPKEDVRLASSRSAKLGDVRVVDGPSGRPAPLFVTCLKRQK